MDIQPHFVFLKLFVHNVNIVYLSYVVCLSCSIHTTSKKGLVMKGHCIEGSHNIAIRHSLHYKQNVVVFKELSSSSQCNGKHFGSPSSSEFDVGNECDYLLGDSFEELEFRTKCVRSIQLNSVVRKSHKVSSQATLYSSVKMR